MQRIPFDSSKVQEIPLRNFKIPSARKCSRTTDSNAVGITYSKFLYKWIQLHCRDW